MKHIYKIFALLVVSLVFISCDRDKGDADYLNNRTNTMFFSDDEGTLFIEEGANNIYNITVGASAVVSSDAQYTITLDPSSTAVEGTDFTILSTSTSFYNGNIVSTFSVQGDFDAASLDGKTAVFNLGSSTPDFEVSSSNQFTLKLIKSCPYEGLDTLDYSAAVTAFDDSAPGYNVTLVPVSGATNQWTVFSGWGPNFVGWATGDPGYNGLYIYSGTIVLNADYSINFIGDDAWATGGTGLYNPCAQTFTYTLTQGLFTTDFTVDVVLSPM